MCIHDLPFKLSSKLVHQRLTKILPVITSINQTGYKKNTSSWEPILNLIYLTVHKKNIIIDCAIFKNVSIVFFMKF